MSIQQPKQQTICPGKLKIFLGYAPGAGATYAMLQAAQLAHQDGTDVVVGFIEPLSQPETCALAEELEVLPFLTAPNMTIDFDLDGALARRPQLIVIDNLAHRAAGNYKRYEDIQRLLAAGIDVYTTVQLLQIGGLTDFKVKSCLIKESVPDFIFDQADQVELVDIEPDDLLKRLPYQHIVQSPVSDDVTESLFSKKSLLFLRELAYRRCADRLNRLRKEKNTMEQASDCRKEHILICLSSALSGPMVIKSAVELAQAFHGDLTALYVESPNTPLSREEHSQLQENLHLAEQAGAKITTMYGGDVSLQIVEYVQAAGIKRIVLGQSGKRRLSAMRGMSLAEQLKVQAPHLDIYIIPEVPSPSLTQQPASGLNMKLSLSSLLKSAGILFFCTLIGLLFSLSGINDSNIITVYILGVLMVSMATDGYLYSCLASILSVVIFNYLFTVPRLTFQFEDNTYFITLLTMLLSAFISSTLTTRVKRQATREAMKSYRTQILLETSQVLQRAESQRELFNQTAQQLIKLLDRPIMIYPAGEVLEKPLCFSSNGLSVIKELLCTEEQAVAQWVYQNLKCAGATTENHPDARCLYMPVRNHSTVFAVVAIAMDTYVEPEAFEKGLLASMLNEFALALEKERESTSKKQIEVKANQEQLRANLLRTISHDLRTPLTSISGNAGILMASSDKLSEGKKQQLYSDIYDDSMWLISLVENMLFVTRIENGTMDIQKEPELVVEVIDEALRHINRRCSEYHITTELSNDLLMARMDSRLIVQVIINIVDNAMKYTPPGSTISLSAFSSDEMIHFEIADNGHGISDQMKPQLFDMFFTGNNRSGDGRRSLGLGLSLCKSIILAHGGEIGVRDNPSGGAIFYFTLEAEEIKAYE